MVKVFKGLKGHYYKLPRELNPFFGSISKAHDLKVKKFDKRIKDHFYSLPRNKELYDKKIIRSYDLKVEEYVKIVPELVHPYIVQEKVIISGDIIEYYHYEKPIVKNVRSKTVSKGKQSAPTEKRADTVNQSIKRLRRLINSNADHRSCFVTLTYKENMQDVDQAKLDFKNFIKRWNYQRKKKALDPLKYVYVIEFQKRGAVHFHVIFFGLEFTQATFIRDIWGHGKIDIKLIDHIDNVGSYIMKYMSKETDDERLKGKDLYGRSKANLKEPKIIEKKELINKLLNKYADKIVYESQFGQTDYSAPIAERKINYRGIITYKQINIKRLNKNKKAI